MSHKHITTNILVFCESSNLFLDEHVNIGLRSNKWEGSEKKIKIATNELMKQTHSVRLLQ